MRATHGDDALSSGAPVVTPTAEPDDVTRGRRGLTYRPGLDGIRAIAIIGVLLFHLNYGWAQGGFLGVDLFFVLSGFLITSLLLTEIRRTGRLSYGAFYLRRARRLLPALGATLLLSIALAWFVARDALLQVLRDIPFALTYITNWAYVFRGQSYFEAIGRPPLLQHLWSLAIEEQFYLVWPTVVVFLAWAFRRHLRSAVAITAGLGALASTASLAWVSARNGYPDLADPSPAYFATHTHAMGILTGAMVAAIVVGRFDSHVPSRAVRHVTGAVGVVATTGVIAAFVLLSQYTSALYRGGLFVFGVVCVLAVLAAAVPGGWFGRGLGVAPLRYVGQRSYGLYLYHWPIFMVLRPGQDISASGWSVTVLRLGLTFAVAELSYRYVEMPVRTGALLRWWRGDAAGARSWLGRRQAWRRIAVVSASAAASVALLVGVVAATPASPRPSAGPVTPASSHIVQGPRPLATPVAPTAPTRPKPVPIVHQGTLMVGDSVMLGAVGGLRHNFSHMHMDAVVGRQPREFPKLLKQLRIAHRLPQVVVIHMGTNGYVSGPILQHALAQLRDVRLVVIVTVHVPRVWTDNSNATIRSLATHYRNVVVADWALAAAGQSGWFVKDGAHLNPYGVKAYTALLARTINDSL